MATNNRLIIHKLPADTISNIHYNPFFNSTPFSIMHFLIK